MSNAHLNETLASRMIGIRVCHPFAFSIACDALWLEGLSALPAHLHVDRERSSRPRTTPRGCRTSAHTTWTSSASRSTEKRALPKVRVAPDGRTFTAGRQKTAAGAAIKSVDPEALVTVGMIQGTVPALLPSGVRHYAAFRPNRQAALLDFLEVHCCLLADGAYEYQGEFG